MTDTFTFGVALADRWCMPYRDPEDARAQKRRYYQANRDRILAQVKARYAANPEKVREYQKGLREGKETREKILAAKRQWNKRRGKRTLTVAQAETNRVRVKRWRAANPERVRLLSRNGRANRRARLRGVTFEHIAATAWEAKVAEYGGRCAYCGEPAMERDHFVPLARGGTHTLDNLVPACGPCNRGKHAKLPEEWIEQCRGGRP